MLQQSEYTSEMKQVLQIYELGIEMMEYKESVETFCEEVNTHTLL